MKSGAGRAGELVVEGQEKEDKRINAQSHDHPVVSRYLYNSVTMIAYHERHDRSCLFS